MNLYLFDYVVLYLYIAKKLKVTCTSSEQNEVRVNMKEFFCLNFNLSIETFVEISLLLIRLAELISLCDMFMNFNEQWITCF